MLGFIYLDGMYPWALDSFLKNKTKRNIIYLFLNPHLRICLVIWQGGGERDIDLLPPIHTLTGDRAHNLVCALIGNRTRYLLVYRSMLQPTEPQGKKSSFICQLYFTRAEIIKETRDPSSLWQNRSDFALLNCPYKAYTYILYKNMLGPYSLLPCIANYPNFL